MKKRTLIWGGLAALGAGLVFALSGKKPPAVGPVDPTVTPVVPSSTRLALLGDPLKLKEGQYYRGRLDLRVYGLPPFRAEANEEELGKGLSALGLRDVRVYMNAGELPTGWPEDGKLNVGSNTRWFVGQWGGVSSAMPRPRELSMMWPTQSPDAARRRAA